MFDSVAIETQHAQSIPETGITPVFKTENSEFKVRIPISFSFSSQKNIQRILLFPIKNLDCSKVKGANDVVVAILQRETLSQ